MNKKLTMFLSDLSVVDHAYINKDGKIIGGSFNPGFLVTGDVDPVENVVVDFSTIKKSIKKLIDDPQIGFDHKLWLIDGYSNCDIKENEQRVEIKSPALHLDLPKDAIKKFAAKEYSLEVMGQALEDYLNKEITAKHSGVFTRCFNSVNIHHLTPSEEISYFTYCHGLKNSTSWGCQNNSHGHLSFVSLFDSENLSSTSLEDELGQLQQQIALELDGTVFMWRENVTAEDDAWVTLEYQSRDRGYFYAKYHKKHNKIVILDTETTVEFLIEHVCKKWQESLVAKKAKVVMLSEGLTKGAYNTL